jgi:hypothetical protein
MALRIQVTGTSLDDAEVAVASRRLRSELLDVADVSTPPGARPEPGAKSGAVATIGLLLVSVAPATIASVVDAALGWLRRQPLDVEMDIDGQKFSGNVTRAQRDQLVATYLDRVAREDPP